MKIQNSSRNSGIDLMRGISVLLVVMHHVGIRIPLKNGVLSSFLPKPILDGLIFNGYEAVFIFFVISGFLITSNSLARWDGLDAIDARSFYMRRAARILPTLIVLLLVLCALHLAGAQDYVIFEPHQSLPAALFSVAGLQLNWYEGQTGYLPANWDVLWSLSIEEVFYLAFPLVCLTLRRERVVLAVMVLFALSLPIFRAAIVGSEIWIEKAYLPAMSGIAMGVAAALVAVHFRPKGRVVALLCGLGTTGVVAVLFFEWLLWPVLGNGNLLLLTFSAACLVLAFHWQACNARPWSIPGTGWLQSCGRLSYEIYLTHMFVVLLVVQVFKASDAGTWWGVLWYVPATVLSYLLGWLVARCISTPSEIAVRRWFVKMEVRAALPIAAEFKP
jgi:peptidoglycan/LPS O-acetylase OafA/YrhL